MEAAAGVAAAVRNGGVTMPLVAASSSFEPSHEEWRVLSEQSVRNSGNEELERSKVGRSDERLIYERLQNLVEKREELQNMELELRVQISARSEIARLQNTFDAQIKERVNANVKLQEQLREKEQKIHELERRMDEKERELHAIRLDNEVGDVESIASKNPKELTALIEQISGSEEYKRPYEELEVQKAEADEKAVLAHQKKKNISAEKKQKKLQKEEAERHLKLQEQLKSLKQDHYLWQLSNIEKDIEKANEDLVVEDNSLKEIVRELETYEAESKKKNKEKAGYLKEIQQCKRRIAEKQSRLDKEVSGKSGEDSPLKEREDCMPSRNYRPKFDRPFRKLIYPKGDPDAVTIRKIDVDCLLPDACLNCTIIDFYIKYLKTRLNVDERTKFHIFSCFFFRMLANPDNYPSSAFDGKAAFQRVRKWTRKVNLLEKDFILIPVNYSHHWSLIVICYFGEVASYEDGDDNSGRVPCILHMDSWRGTHSGLKDLMQSYLREEWKERQKGTCDDLRSKFRNLKFVSLKVPQQQNEFDCGLFLLHYVELFLEEVPPNFNIDKITSSVNFLQESWFPPAKPSIKRIHIKKLISGLLSNLSKYEGPQSGPLEEDLNTTHGFEDDIQLAVKSNNLGGFQDSSICQGEVKAECFISTELDEHDVFQHPHGAESADPTLVTSHRDSGSHSSAMQSDGEVAAEKTIASSPAAGKNVIVVSESDDDDDVNKDRRRESAIRHSRKRKRNRRRESAIRHSRKRKRNTGSTTDATPKNLEFIVTLPGHGYRMFIPKEFAVNTGIPKKMKLIIMDKKRREWPVTVTDSGERRCYRMGAGILQFLRGNGVKGGSTILFKLIHSSEDAVTLVARVTPPLHPLNDGWD